MKTADKISWSLREAFPAALADAFELNFSLCIETTFDLFACALVTGRDDGAALTPEQSAFIAGFERAWLVCAQIVQA